MFFPGLIVQGPLILGRTRRPPFDSAIVTGIHGGAFRLYLRTLLKARDIEVPIRFDRLMRNRGKSNTAPTVTAISSPATGSGWLATNLPHSRSQRDIRNLLFLAA